MTLSTYEKSPISSEKPSKVERHSDYCSSKFATGGSIDSLFRNERQKKRKLSSCTESDLIVKVDETDF